MSIFRKINKRLLPPNQKISENNAKSSEYDSLQVFLEFHEKHLTLFEPGHNYYLYGREEANCHLHHAEKLHI